VSAIFYSKWCGFLCLLDRFAEIFFIGEIYTLLVIDFDFSFVAVRFVLAFDTFLQVQVALSITNAGTIALVLAAIIAAGYFFGPNINAALVERCAYQFAPWFVFIIFFWGVLENNWIPKNVTRNDIIAAVELVACVVSAIFALALFAMRYRASKIDPIA